MKKFQGLLSLAEWKESWGEKESQCYGVSTPDSEQGGPRQEPLRDWGGLARKGSWGLRALI